MTLKFVFIKNDGRIFMISLQNLSIPLNIETVKSFKDIFQIIDLFYYVMPISPLSLKLKAKRS